jgi:branched-chain amino acid transport system permease protein
MMRLIPTNLKLSYLLLALAVAGVAIAPLWLSEYTQHIVIVCMYYVIMATSWNLLAGYTGQFSLAHATFAALGAYASGLLIFHLDVSLVVGFLGAVGVTMLTGFLLGLLVLKMRGIYLAVATWAFSESFRLVIAAAYKFTRGEQGLSVPPLFGTLDPTPYYYLFLVATTVLLLIMYLVVKSPIGSFLKAIRDDELAAAAMGVDTVKWKLFVMVFASTIAGIAGYLYAHYIIILSPVILSFNEMGKIVVMTVFGGLGAFAGPLLGAPAVVFLSELMRDFGALNMVFYSLAVIIIMRVNREGLVSLLRKGVALVFGRQKPQESQAT